MAVQVRAEILERRPTGEYHLLRMRAPGIAPSARPGHFVALAVGGPESALLLRRAFSIHRVDVASQTVEVVFAEHGAGTAWLARTSPGSTIDVIGPLGHPFALPDEPVGAVLVAGGYGAAPMFDLAGLLRARGCRVAMILGAARAGRLFGVDLAAQVADTVTVTTDDGSAGITGRVTDVLATAMAGVDAHVVYACGPMAMLAAVSRVADEAGAACQCAVEEAMACGIGVCMTCVLPVRGADGVTRMVRSCTEGPVFDGTSVRWSDVGTVPADTLGAIRVAGH